MNIKYILVAVLLTSQYVCVQSFGWAIMGIATSALSALVTVAEQRKVWVVEVHNESKYQAHLWCASKNDRIGGKGGLWVKPGQKIAWAFRRARSTQFWCTMDWNKQRVGWDVFVTNWKDAPSPTKWSIRNNGVYDQWKNRKWRKLKA